MYLRIFRMVSFLGLLSTSLLAADPLTVLVACPSNVTFGDIAIVLGAKLQTRPEQIVKSKIPGWVIVPLKGSDFVTRALKLEKLEIMRGNETIKLPIMPATSSASELEASIKLAREPGSTPRKSATKPREKGYFIKLDIKGRITLDLINFILAQQSVVSPTEVELSNGRMRLRLESRERRDQILQQYEEITYYDPRRNRTKSIRLLKD